MRRHLEGEPQGYLVRAAVAASVMSLPILPTGRDRFYANGRGLSSGLRYQELNLSRLPSSVAWTPGHDTPREHAQSRYGNKKH